MSTVWLAMQESLQRKIAIKLMRRTHDSSSDDARQFEKRFLLEGRTMAKLPHRNIVAVYDIVSTEDVAYIAMEFLEGGTLSERMQAGLSLAEAISVVVQIAGALDFAHSQGIIHRDLKPANIMFRDATTPVLTDFGIARQQDQAATRLTQTGMLVGTPNYMSPEQISGSDIDGRSDLYSLGIMFYELLSGSTPFNGDTPIAVMMAHLTQPPPPLEPEFAHFQSVLDKMLAKNRDERYATMHDFVAALKQRVVASDTLLMRLQLQPGMTSSEQLRQLGFTASDPAGSGLRSASGIAQSQPLPRPQDVAARKTGGASSRRARRPPRCRLAVLRLRPCRHRCVSRSGRWSGRGSRGRRYCCSRLSVSASGAGRPVQACRLRNRRSSATGSRTPSAWPATASSSRHLATTRTKCCRKCCRKIPRTKPRRRCSIASHSRCAPKPRPR